MRPCLSGDPFLLHLQTTKPIKDTFFSVHPYANAEHATLSLFVILCNTLVKQPSV